MFTFQRGPKISWAYLKVLSELNKMLKTRSKNIIIILQIQNEEGVLAFEYLPEHIPLYASLTKQDNTRPGLVGREILKRYFMVDSLNLAGKNILSVFHTSLKFT